MLDLWGLEVAAEWVWVKVTTQGEAMFDVDGWYRKPWEKLLIARRKRRGAERVVADKVIVAVPDLHSRKPNLRKVFAEVFGKEYVGLELFARNLTQGWWSWGDEVLKFQEEQWWQTPDG